MSTLSSRCGNLALTLPDLAFLLTALSFPLPYQVHYALVGVVYG